MYYNNNWLCISGASKRVLAIINSLIDARSELTKFNIVISSMIKHKENNVR